MEGAGKAIGNTAPYGFFAVGRLDENRLISHKTGPKTMRLNREEITQRIRNMPIPAKPHRKMRMFLCPALNPMISASAQPNSQQNS